MNRLAYLISLLHLVACKYNWLTVVLVDFQLREECTKFWNEHNNCANPSLRISANIGRQRFASASWPISERLFEAEKRYFTSQWKTTITSLLVSAQVEGENALNPFGLHPKCDSGYNSFTFNATEEQQIRSDNGRTTNTRIASIHSQCFTAKMLIRIDTECPNCRMKSKTPMAEPRTGLFYEIESSMQSVDIVYFNGFLAAICILSIVLLIAVIELTCSRRRMNRVQEKQCITPAELEEVSVTDSSAKIAQLRQIPRISSTNDTSEYYYQSDASVTYGYQLNTQKIRVFTNGSSGSTLPCIPINYYEDYYNYSLDI